MIVGYPLVVFLLGLGLVSLAKLAKVGRRPKGAPPGPPTVPLLGNLHLVRPMNYLARQLCLLA